MYKINHIHIKSNDPEKDANWFINAFNFEIINDEVRSVGDRFISCQSEDGFRVNISGERTNEKLGPSDADPHYGLEHFGLDSKNLEEDIQRLEGLGATLSEGPNEMPGMRIAFLKTPGNVRVELIQKDD
ncbi:MAG: hypothetical protein CL769_04685 [Chloroflexi bacterium]|nr:hypothetical protein [Chloroflexota bacterium]MBK66231.1 hypothetical protein [Chloroflexota bacterium]|tara:strand:+ start:2279 stop:2665 length:387 start_codon:yes stop_codon:yes gene_type:complete